MNATRISDNNAVEQARVVRPLTEINERECLAKLAAEVPAAGSIVEIGCLYGGMTAVMGLANPLASIVSIDDFSWHPSDDVPTSPELLLQNMERIGVSNVKVLVGDSREIGKSWNTPIDLLWVDGGHSFEYVWDDLMNFGPRANVIAVHDFGNPAWQSIGKAVGLFLKQYQNYQLAEVVNTVAVLRRIA